MFRKNHSIAVHLCTLQPYLQNKKLFKGSSANKPKAPRPPEARLKPVTEGIADEISDLDLNDERQPVVFAGGNNAHAQRCARMVVSLCIL